MGLFDVASAVALWLQLALVIWMIVAVAAFIVAMVFYFMLRLLISETLSSPVVQAFGRAAQAFTKGGGDWKAELVRGGMKVVGKVADSLTDGS